MGRKSGAKKLPLSDGGNHISPDVREGKAGAGGSLKRRNPGLQARVSGNEVNDQENNVMTNNSTAVSNVIQFRFEAKEVRTVLVGDQPWFVAVDVCESLGIVNTARALSRLDDDEKGIHSMNTQGGTQNMSTLNESGLYALILTSRKAEAKRFKKWVTSEVLPAIRKHGRYEDSQKKMSTLMDELIGMTETNALKGLARHKVSILPVSSQRSAAARIYSAMHTRFNVPRLELIPASQFDAACNFVAAYVLDGEWLPKQEPAGVVVLDAYAAQHVYLLMSRVAAMNKHRVSLGGAANALGSEPLMSVYSQLLESRSSFGFLDRHIGKAIYDAYRSLVSTDGGYAMGREAA